MARERLSGSLTSSSSQNVPPGSASTSMARKPATGSRLPVKTKRPILGERTDNLEHAATPRQHLVKPAKSVVMPRLSMSVKKHTAPPATPSTQISPSASEAPTPAVGLNHSRPGHTPHPRRSSVGLGQIGNADDTMLMDMSAADYLVSDSEASEAGEQTIAAQPPAGRGVRGFGRLMTPENSQETRTSGMRKQASPARTVTRLPTPPSSQADDEYVVPRSLVRPRPEPTPPRATSSALRLAGLTAPAHNASPNPRRKKSPRPDEEDMTSPLQSNFPSTNAHDTPRAATLQPRDRVEVVIERPRKSVSKSSMQTTADTPRASKPATKKKGRSSVRTPAVSHTLSISTSSKSGKSSKAPATAPPANRRKSTPRAPTKKTTPPRTSLPAQKSNRLSVSRARKSVTPAELRAMVGILPKPIEPGSPSDDPLLLVADDETTWGTPAPPSRAKTASKASSSRVKTLSAARVIDFDKPIASSSRLAPPTTADGAVAQEYDVPVHGSEPDHYDDQPMWGNESDGGSDIGDVGNDTFIHVTGGAQPHHMLAESVNPPSMSRDTVRSMPSTSTPRPAETTTPVLSPAPIPAWQIQTTTPEWVNKQLGLSPKISRSPATTAAIDAAPAVSAQGPAASPVETQDEDPAEDNDTELSVADITEQEIEESFNQQDSLAPSPISLETGKVASSPARPLPSIFASTTPTLTPPRSLRLGMPSPQPAVLARSTTPAFSPAGMRAVTGLPSSTAQLISRLDAMISPRLASPVAHLQHEEVVETQDALASSVSSPPIGDRTVTSSPVGSAGRARTPLPTSPVPSHSSPVKRVEVEVETEPFGALGLFLTSGSSLEGASTPVSPSTDVVREAPTNGESQVSTTPTASPQSRIIMPSSSRRGTSPLHVFDPSAAELAPAPAGHNDESTTPLIPAAHEMPVMSSPKVPKSPLPAMLDDEEDDEVDASVDLSEEVEQDLAAAVATASASAEAESTTSTSPPPAESTTPIAPPPARLGRDSPAQYAMPFAPKYASPLGRVVQLRSPTPAQDAGEPEPIDQIQQQSSSGPLEESTPEEPFLGDVTLEGNSADWSLSDDVPSADVTQDGDSANWDLSDEDAEVHQSPHQEDEYVDDAPTANSNPVEIDEQDSIEDGSGESFDNSGNSEADDTAAPQTGPAGPKANQQAPPDEAEDQEKADETDEEEEYVSEDEESESPPPSTSKKIILKVINRGVVKVEPEAVLAVDVGAPPTPPATGVSPTIPGQQIEDERSTTPAYDPPTRLSAMPTPRSAVSVYPELPASPALSARSPASPAPRPSRQDASDVAQHASPRIQHQQISLASRPLAAARQAILGDDEADQSIRVRSRPSLADELSESDQSMRSVVEVSSLDPMAAARAAAILKMNHAYIEHGDLSKLDKSRRSATPHRKSFNSFRRVDKTELLHEAELEIVSTRRSRSRSMSRFRGVSEAPTDLALALPGGWNGTPKRKHSALDHPAPAPVDEVRTKTWGVSHWKKLEKVFRAERELWTKEREVKSMPGGFIGWARRSTFGSPAPVSKPWDPMRVVQRFCMEQGITEAKQMGDWSVEMLRTRVEALERHAEHRKTSSHTGLVQKETEPSPKKPRVAVAQTPAKKTISARDPPPSSIRRMFGWVLPSSTSTSSSNSSTAAVITEPEVPAPRFDYKGKGKAKETELPFETAEFRPTMSQIGASTTTFAPSTLSNSPIPHPSSPAWKSSAPPVRPPSLLSQTRPTPKTLSAILAASSSSTASESSSGDVSRLSLNPSFSQRSTAINALFAPPGDKSITSKSVTMPVKRSSSVKDLVRSFEDSGLLARSHSREDLQRKPSRPV